MKKRYFLIPLAAALLAGSCSKDSYDDTELWSKVNSLDQRVTKLEGTLTQMNQDIKSINTIVTALQKNVSITNVTQIASGYQISFSDGKSIIINHGKDGLDGSNMQPPYIGTNGNWWIGMQDSGVKAAGKDGKDGKDGLTPYVGSNGNWWIGNEDSGIKAAGKDGTDGLTPYIGTNGNWWIGQKDSGVPAKGEDGKDGTDGLTPFIGQNGNWWIGSEDTGVPAQGIGGNGSTGGSVNVPIISVDEEGGIYYWVQILNGTKTWLTDKAGNRLPVTGNNGKDGINGTNGTNGKDGITPIIRIDTAGYWIISYDNGITFQRILNEYNQPVQAGKDCDCQQFFRSVQVSNGYLIMVLIDGTVLRFTIAGGGGGGGVTPTPSLPRDPNVILPNPRFVVRYIPGQGYVLVAYVSGFQDPNTGNWLTYSDGSDGNTRNTWIDIDNNPHIIDIDKPENEEGKRVPTDLVFLVDNSGSMSEEADFVARFILDWSAYLVNAGQDVQFGVVGFSIDGKINGALDLTTAPRLNSYLNYNGRKGTDRTTNFTEQNMLDAAKLYSVSDECGAMALRYADANMSFRSGSVRHYCIFTDEPNQPNGNMNYSTSWFDPNKKNWTTDKGVVHVIYSGNDNFTNQIGKNEHYNVFSTYTGGSYKQAKTDLSDIDYKSIPLAKSLVEMKIIYIGLNPSLVDGKTHTVKLTYISADNKVVGQNSYQVTFSPQQ